MSASIQTFVSLVSVSIPGVHFGPKFLEVGAAYTNVVGTRRHTPRSPGAESNTTRPEKPRSHGRTERSAHADPHRVKAPVSSTLS